MSKVSRMPWLALGILVSMASLYWGSWLLHALHVTLPACPMKSYLGIPCATCGLSRCVPAWSEGHWAEAFHWHPVAVLLGLTAPFAMGWDLRRAYRGELYPALPASLTARLSVAGLLAGTWLLQIARGI